MAPMTAAVLLVSMHYLYTLLLVFVLVPGQGLLQSETFWYGHMEDCEPARLTGYRLWPGHVIGPLGSLRVTCKTAPV